MAKKEAERKGFIWYSLRAGFWILLGIEVLSFLVGLLSGFFGLALPASIWLPLGFLILGLIPFNLIISIIHLIKYKKKALAVSALILSVVLLLIIIL